MRELATTLGWLQPAVQDLDLAHNKLVLIPHWIPLLTNLTNLSFVGKQPTLCSVFTTSYFLLLVHTL